MSRACKHLEEKLDELQRISDLESLRPYLNKEQCFLSLINHETSPITTEELKRLARIWKLDQGDIVS
jgi:hypothetical protein